jgi:hypothetical protein
MYKIVIALLFLLFLTGAVEEDQNTNAVGGCATTGGTVIHAGSPDSQMTPSYFNGGAQALENRK